MQQDFFRATVGKLPAPVFRLGLSASYRPGKRVIHQAIDEGINYFFLYGFDTQMTSVLREVLPRARDKYVVATGAYNYIYGAQDLRRTLEKRLRQLRTDYIDVFEFLGVMKPREFTPRVRAQIEELRQDPRVGAVAMSCHDRKFAAQLAADGTLDAIMIRYNAAHRGAEQDIFPHPGRPASRRHRLHRHPLELPAAPPQGLAEGPSRADRRHVLPLRALEPERGRLPHRPEQRETLRPEPRRGPPRPAGGRRDALHA